MKRIILTAILSGLVISGPAFARHWRVGANLGLAIGNSGVSDINSQLASSGLNATASSSDDKRMAWSASIGYKVTPKWEVDLSYVNLGKVSTTFSGTASSIDTFLSASSHIHPNTARALRLTETFRQIIWSVPQFHVTETVGFFGWRSDYTLNGVSTSLKVHEHGLGPTLGIGLEKGLDQIAWMPRHLSADANWNIYSIDNQLIHMLSIGLIYSFK